MSSGARKTSADTGKLVEAMGARTSARIGLLTTLPAQLLLIFIVVFPTIVTVYISLTWWTPLDGIPWTEAYQSFAWFDNYTSILDDRKLMAALGRTLFIVIVACAFEFVLGFGLALLFVDKF